MILKKYSLIKEHFLKYSYKNAHITKLILKI